MRRAGWLIVWLGLLGGPSLSTLVAQEAELPPVTPIDLSGPAELKELPAPWTLKDDEVAERDAVLAKWKQASGTVQSLTADLRVWEFDGIFQRKDEYHGRLRFAGRQQWDCRLLYRKGLNAWEKLPHPEGVALSDGTYYAYNHFKKQLEAHPLDAAAAARHFPHGIAPTEVRFSSFNMHLSDLRRPARLPMLVSDLDKLLDQFHVRLTENKNGKIWLELAERNNGTGFRTFKTAELILDAETHLPQGIKVYQLDGVSHTTYAFGELAVNGEKPVFGEAATPKPTVPEGYTAVTLQPTKRLAGKPITSDETK